MAARGIIPRVATRYALHDHTISLAHPQSHDGHERIQHAIYPAIHSPMTDTKGSNMRFTPLFDTIIKHDIDTNTVPFLAGEPGIGKSSFILDFFKNNYDAPCFVLNHSAVFGRRARYRQIQLHS